MTDQVSPKTGLKHDLKRQLRWALATVVLLFAVLFSLGRVFGEELEFFAVGVSESFGLGGLAVLLFLSDGLISPIAPDIFLVIVAKGSWAWNHWLIVLLLSVVSTLAGQVGFWGGKLLSHTHWVQAMFGKRIDENQIYIEKYGPWAVAIAALFPLPYSVLCWIGGTVNLPFGRFFLATTLRVPRFFIYYGAIELAIAL